MSRRVDGTRVVFGNHKCLGQNDTFLILDQDRSLETLLLYVYCTTGRQCKNIRADAYDFKPIIVPNRLFRF